jgi:F-type H+-transporting ATPase subunit epsilon
MTAFPFSLLTPAGALLNEAAVFVGVRSVEGSLGVLARHAPMVAACPPGVVRVQRDSGWSYYATTAAILTTDGHKVVVLTDRAESASDEITALATVRLWQQEDPEE